MKHYLYFIYSKQRDKFYVGETNDINKRLEKHNSHYYKKAFTNNANDWVIKLSFQCSSKEKARFLEQFIKRMKSKKFIKKVIADPNILSEILLNQN